MNRRLRRTHGRIDFDMKVLIVEDEPLLASTLIHRAARRGLRRRGGGHGVDGLAQATENDFDVVVLDIMLPGLNGYEVLRRMRTRGSGRRY